MNRTGYESPKEIAPLLWIPNSEYWSLRTESKFYGKVLKRRNAYGRWLLVWFIVAGLLCLACGPEIADAITLSKAEKAYLEKKKTITFVSQTRYPPFEFVGKNAEHTGMCIELARWMATELGFKARFTDMAFQDAQQAKD